ncbi:MAG: hypothetical protein AAB545_01085 [Patescibacteria group bacterium]
MKQTWQDYEKAAERGPMAIAVKVILAVFMLGISVACSRGTDSQHPFQKYVEGVVEKVEYTQTGSGFLNPGHQNNHLYFTDGRSVSLPGTLPASKAIEVGKFNRIWFDDNSAQWIRDVEIIIPLSLPAK